MSMSRLFLFVTIILGILTVATFGLLKLWSWMILYACIYAVVLLTELISYLAVKRTISTTYRRALKSATGARKFWLVVAPTLAVLTLIGLWVHLVWGAL